MIPLVIPEVWVPLAIIGLVIGCVIGWLVGNFLSGDL